MLKRFFVTVLSIALIFSFSVVSYAETDQIGYENTEFEVNELQMMNELKEMPFEVLMEEGYTYEQIDKIKEFDIIQYIEELSKLSDEELILRGYGNYETEFIRSFDEGDPNKLEVAPMVIGAKVTISLNALKTSSKTADVNINWSWDYQPNNTWSDIVALSWSKGFNSDAASSYCLLNYVDDLTGRNYWKESKITDKSPGGGCAFKFGMKENSYWVKSGYAKVKLYNDVNVGVFEVRTSYGHNIISVSPSVSWPYSVGVSFSMGMDEAATAYTEVRN